jgi:predicted CXXCH cytochrome family protein
MGCRRITRAAGACALAAACATAWACASAPPRSAGARAAAPAGPVVVHSNVARGDYAGSAACASCHAEVTEAWARSPMHRMTRDARGAEARAPFDGSRWRFKDDAAVLERSGDDRLVRVESGGQARTYRVTRIIGGRTREDYAGVDVAGGSDEEVLPVSFVYATGALRYKGYSVMVHERVSLRAGPVWSKTCVFCHNTVPEVDRLLGAIGGPGARPYQGEQVDRWLPAPRRGNARVTDDAGFTRVVTDELARLGSTGGRIDDGAGARNVARRAIESVRDGFDGDDLVEVGIGCEACHGGSREHARDPRVRPTLVPTAPWLDVRATPAQAETRVCARCHQVLFSQYPFTWEGGRNHDATAGGSHINSGEGRDFLLGGCASAMTCTACHDPHRADARAALAALATPSGNATCTRCHAKLADGESLRAHAHHDPRGAGGACIACHMPRKNMGLDGVLTRYHRIGSPTDPARVLGDRPLECALCHADKSVRTLVDTMEKWWRVAYPRQRMEELYGSLDANVMRATLERGKPHEQVVAMATLGESHARDAAPAIAAQLLNAYPLVREWAKRSLVALLGRCEVDLARDDASIAREAAACAGSAVATPALPQAGPSHEEDPED